MFREQEKSEAFGISKSWIFVSDYSTINKLTFTVREVAPRWQGLVPPVFAPPRIQHVCRRLNTRTRRAPAVSDEVYRLTSKQKGGTAVAQNARLHFLVGRPLG